MRALSPSPWSARSLSFARASNAADVDRSALATLTNLVTIALSESPRFEVVASSDVREVIALEAERQALGCESDTSCLAEVAGAMGALFGAVGLETIGEAEKAHFQDDAIQKREEANRWGLAANTSFVVGAGFILVGGALAALELLSGGEE